MTSIKRKSFELILSNDRSREQKNIIIQTNLMKPIDLSAPDSVKLEVGLKRCSYPKGINHPRFAPIRFLLNIPYYADGIDERTQYNLRANVVVPDLDKESTMAGMVSKINRIASQVIVSTIEGDRDSISIAMIDLMGYSLSFNMFLQRNNGRYYIKNLSEKYEEGEDNTASMTKIEDNDLWRAFGFTQFRSDAEFYLPVEAESSPMFDERCHLMMVVAPGLIDPQEVAGRQLPLLATIPISQDTITSRNERATVYRKRPIYKKVRTTRFADIRLEFLDQDQKPIIDPELQQLDVILQFRQC